MNRFFILIFTLCLPAMGHATEDTEALLAKIRQETGKIQTLSADFSSVKKVSFLKDPINSRGRLYYSSEGKMRWEILFPFKLAMTFDGSKVNRYTQDQQGIWKPLPPQFDPVLAEVMKQLQVWLSGRAFTMDKNYQVRVLSQQPVRIQLIPRREDMQRMLKSLDFTFGKELNVVTMLQLTEGSGDTTRIEYRNLQLNQPMEGGLFQ